MKPGKLQTPGIYDRIIHLLESARSSTIQHVNRTMVTAYFEIGRMIVEEEQGGDKRAAYGKAIIQELSDRLTVRFGRGFSIDNLENMRRFFLVYSISETLFRKSSTAEGKDPMIEGSDTYEISQAAPATFQLSWSHYLKLMRMDDINERRFYEIEAYNNNWSVRELQRQFDTGHFRIDLVFYNRLLKSFVLIDLKIGELKHQDLGQMQMYVNFYDRLCGSMTKTQQWASSCAATKARPWWKLPCPRIIDKFLPASTKPFYPVKRS